MLPEWILNATAGWGKFLGLSPENGVYFFVLIISLALGVSLAIRFENAMVGIAAFMGTLTVMAVMGMFPLWIIGLALVVIIIFYARPQPSEGGMN